MSATLREHSVFNVRVDEIKMGNYREVCSVKITYEFEGVPGMYASDLVVPTKIARKLVVNTYYKLSLEEMKFE
jgi:hypothetical protein